jgi:hypothetical protein
LEFGVQFPVRPRDLPVSHNLQTGLECHSVFCTYKMIPRVRLEERGADHFFPSIAEVRNCAIIPYVTEVIRTYAKNHRNRAAQNNNQLIRDLFNQPEIGRRLHRMCPEDLIR